VSEPLVVHAPVPGRVLPMAQVPDPVFAQAMVGPGAAIDPQRGMVVAVAPVAGSISTLHPHAYVVVTDSGRGVLVHLGIDTVQLKGEGFRLLVAKGDQVSAGDPVVEWDTAAIEAGGRSPICPVVALDASADAIHLLALSSADGSGDDVVQAQTGDGLFSWD